MIAEGDHTYLSFAVHGISSGKYNQAGLAMYELPNLFIRLAITEIRGSLAGRNPLPPAAVRVGGSGSSSGHTAER